MSALVAVEEERARAAEAMDPRALAEPATVMLSEQASAPEHAATELPAPSARGLTFARWTRRLTLIGWVTWIGLLLWALQSGLLTSVTRLREFIDGFGPLAPIVYALVGASEAIVPVIPGSATIVAAPLLFGPVVGTLAAYAGTCLGSIAVFAISRHVGQDLLVGRFKPQTLARYLGWLEHPHFTRWFALAIALPIAPDDALCYLAGLSRMRARTFVLIILLLKPWALMAYTFGILALLKPIFPWLSS